MMWKLVAKRLVVQMVVVVRIVILGIAVPIVAYRNVVPIQIPVVNICKFIKNLPTVKTLDKKRRIWCSLSNK